MMNPLHAHHYADDAVDLRGAEIVENLQLARDTWRVRVLCPELAARIRPGQFIMIRLHDCDDPLIGRPLALYDTYDGGDEATEAKSGNAPAGIDVVYLVKGKLTTALSHRRAGDRVDLWGPLGNGFAPVAADHLILVAGGIGQTPFLALAKQQLGIRDYDQRQASPPHPSASRVTLCYGARTAELLAGVRDFADAGVDVRVCTDDGSHGRLGLVTDLLEELLDEDPRGQRRQVICCGPEPMMEAAAAIAVDRGVACQVSLETPMACGIGICFSCVAKVNTGDGGWDYKRTCVEGPVFDASAIHWER